MSRDSEISSLGDAFSGLADTPLALHWTRGTTGIGQQMALTKLCVSEGLAFLAGFFSSRTEPAMSLRRVALEAATLIKKGRIIVQFQPVIPGADSLRTPSVSPTLTADGERTVLLVSPGWVNDVLTTGNADLRVEALASLMYAATLAEHEVNRLEYLDQVYMGMGMAAISLGGDCLPKSDTRQVDLEHSSLARHQQLSAWQFAVLVLRAGLHTSYTATEAPFSTWLAGPPI